MDTDPMDSQYYSASGAFDTTSICDSVTESESEDDSPTVSRSSPPMAQVDQLPLHNAPPSTPPNLTRIRRAQSTLYRSWLTGSWDSSPIPPLFQDVPNKCPLMAPTRFKPEMSRDERIKKVNTHAARRAAEVGRLVQDSETRQA